MKRVAQERHHVLAQQRYKNEDSPEAVDDARYSREQVN